MSEEAAAPAVWGPTVVEPVLKLDDDQSLIQSLLAPALCAGIRSQQYSTVDFDPVDDVTPRDVSVERIEEADIGDRFQDLMTRTSKYVLQKVDERDGEEIPKYPILRYMVLGAEAEETEGHQTYDDALALNAFVSEFVAMLQAGFKLVKHMPRQPSKLYVLTLSADCAVLSWTMLKPKDHKVLTKRRVADAGVLADPSTLTRVPHSRKLNCFGLTFAPYAERQAGLAPREIHVFEPANLDTKRLLVDGFQLLVERAVREFFTSSDFRVPKPNNPRHSSRPARSSANRRGPSSSRPVSTPNRPAPSVVADPRSNGLHATVSPAAPPAVTRTLSPVASPAPAPSSGVARIASPVAAAPSGSTRTTAAPAPSGVVTRSSPPFKPPLTAPPPPSKNKAPSVATRKTPPRPSTASSPRPGSLASLGSSSPPKKPPSTERKIIKG